MIRAAARTGQLGAGSPSRAAIPLALLGLSLIACYQARAQDHSAQSEDTPPAPAPPKNAVLGEWIDGGALRFRVDTIANCGTTVTGPGRLGATPDAGAPGAVVTRAPSTLLAFTVRVVAGAGEVFVSPRDVTLEAGGVILQTVNARTPLAPRCEPVLMVRRLPSRQTARGVVLFEVSPEFRAEQTPKTLVYRPTRWGGAGRLQVQIPNCLDRCKEPAKEPAH